MPTYVYGCHNKNCKHEFEIFQTLHDEPLIKCPKCKRKRLLRIPQLINFSVIKHVTEAKTIGEYNDKNKKKKGKAWVEDRKRQIVEEPKIARRKMAEKMADKLPAGMSIMDVKPENPWWRKNKSVNKKLMKANANQKHKYIVTGDIT